MFKRILFGLCIVFIVACSNSKKQVDVIIYNAQIYAVDSSFSVHQAMAIKDGKVVAVNYTEFINNSYDAKEKINADGKTIFPGFIDAHCHFYAYGKGLQEVDLVGTLSYQEVIDRIVEHQLPNNENANKDALLAPSANSWIIGRGWDQNDWQQKEFPDNHILDSLFPNRPVLLTRVDGHAAIVNSVALKLAKFTVNTKIPGGELVIKNNQLSGLLIDNAVDSIQKFIPKANEVQVKRALLAAQKNCVQIGLTTIDDAGLEKSVIDMIDQLQKNGELKMRIYAMLTPNEENIKHYLQSGTYKTERLNVRSFKFYGDGALGSRGACMCKEYADKAGWKGFLLKDISYFDQHAKLMAEKGFQMNTHCIGDSSAKVILGIYQKYLINMGDPRWRIEHAQVLDSASFNIFSKKIIPSVQPTHATSDMYWAAARIGNRIKNAYAYKRLLVQSGILALGTDFPVEDINPFKTFFAAVVRKDAKGFPKDGFQMENGITREEALKGMTIWAAFSNFEEKEKGSLEPGKYADFVMLDTDLMKCKESDILKTKVLATYINGEKVYGVNEN